MNDLDADVVLIPGVQAFQFTGGPWDDHIIERPAMLGTTDRCQPMSDVPGNGVWAPAGTWPGEQYVPDGVDEAGAVRMTWRRVVLGAPRTDPFLGLDDAGDTARFAAMDAARRHHYAAVDRHDWAEMGRLQRPEVGDLVLELTRASWTKNLEIRRSGFGYLVARDGEHWYVQYGPGPEHVCDWQGAMFIRAVLPDAPPRRDLYQHLAVPRPAGAGHSPGDDATL